MGAILDAKPAAAITPTTQVALSAIKNDGGTQMRAALNTDTILEYEATLRESDGWPFPPVILFYDGDGYWLADGFHRVSAAHRVPLATIPADVRAGNRRDAVLFAAGANASHGLRRTNADKRRAVETLLRDEEWAKWSNEEIARRCQVSAAFVGKMKSDLSLNGLEMPTERTVTRNGQTYTQNTANIGQTRPRRLFVNELHAIVTGWVSQHWQREWPENPSHTNGTFWQELTAWLHENRTETWTEADLKTAIKEAHASRPVASAPPPPAPAPAPQPAPAPRSDWQSVRTGIAADLRTLGDVQWHPGQGWRVVATDGEIHGPDLHNLSGCLDVLRRLQAAAQAAAERPLPDWAAQPEPAPPMTAALQDVGATWELVITPQTDPAALGADLRDMVPAAWMEALWNAYMGGAA